MILTESARAQRRCLQAAHAWGVRFARAVAHGPYRRVHPADVEPPNLSPVDAMVERGAQRNATVFRRLSKALGRRDAREAGLDRRILHLGARATQSRTTANARHEELDLARTVLAPLSSLPAPSAGPGPRGVQRRLTTPLYAPVLVVLGVSEAALIYISLLIFPAATWLLALAAAGLAVAFLMTTHLIGEALAEAPTTGRRVVTAMGFSIALVVAILSLAWLRTETFASGDTATAIQVPWGVPMALQILVAGGAIVGAYLHHDGKAHTITQAWVRWRGAEMRARRDERRHQRAITRNERLTSSRVALIGAAQAQLDANIAFTHQTVDYFFAGLAIGLTDLEARVDLTESRPRLVRTDLMALFRPGSAPGRSGISSFRDVLASAPTLAPRDTRWSPHDSGDAPLQGHLPGDANGRAPGGLATPDGLDGVGGSTPSPSENPT